MTRNTKFRECGKGFEIFGYNFYDIFNDVYGRHSNELKNDMENLVSKNIPGANNKEPGNFPYNIEKIFWVNYENFDAYSHDSKTYLLVMNTKKNFVYFKYETEGCSCGISDQNGEIYCCDSYEDLINYAMSESEYQLYMKETQEIWKFEISRTLPSFYFEASCEDDKIVNLGKELENKKILFKQHLMKNLPRLPKLYKGGEISDFLGLNFCIGFDKFMGWGYEYLKHYLKENPYIYIIDDSELHHKNKLIDEKKTLKMNPLNVLNDYDGIMYNDFEGKYWRLNEDVKVKLMYKFIISVKFPKMYKISYDKIIPEL